ncbi:MAG: hypothetical protein ACMG6E_05655 [Candidatus Roizmanbacteria bacterium]
MNQGEFVRGKRLIDPVTGRLERDHDEEDEEKSEDSFESIEQASIQRKRSKTHESDVDMNSESNS